MKRYSRILTICLIFVFLISSVLSVCATEETTAYPVITTSNDIEGWPEGPEIASGCAVVIEAETGTVIYDKNMNQQAYPASITKLMTAALTVENCTMNEMVEFSDEAVFSVPRDSSHIAMTPGEFLSVENCLYGLILASANEVANALGEHISGSIEAFVDLMNERAKELGAVNTHFNNTNGLPDEEHYTTCYDMAMISRAVVFHEAFIKINSTTSYMIPATNLQPEQRPVNTFHRLLISGSMHYDGCFGGKTGYTTAAGNTLVTFAERNGMTLICVVMKSDSTHVYQDSTALLNYGFENFVKMNIAENETKFNLQGSGFFDSANSIFERSYPQISLNQDGIVILPVGADFSEAEPEVVFRNGEESGEDANVLADIVYTWHEHFVGSTTLDVTSVTQNAFSFSASAGSEAQSAGEIKKESESGVSGEMGEPSEKEYIQVNVWYILAGIMAVTALIGLVHLLKKTRHKRERWNRIRRQKRQSRIAQKKRRKRKYYPTRKLH